MYLVTVAIVLSLGLCVESDYIGDNVKARNIFHKGDLDKDHYIRMDEFIRIFMDFDQNDDGIVTTPEFVGEWTLLDLGPYQEAVVLFYNIDVDKDGQLSENEDLKFVFTYFDRDNDGQITEAEFVVQWIKLSVG